MAYDTENDAVSSHDDLNLTHEDIQKLAQREGVIQFFATLGYETSEHIEQTVQAMGFSSETMRSALRSIYRVASQDAGLFEVYLFEVRSLTVAVRNEIVQRFRAYNGVGYLLILTDNYERLDFVLTERYNQTITLPDETLQQQQLPNSGTQPTSIRSHVLQVERLKPNEVVLRVLRRFTFTETDSLAQHDKLLNAYIVATWSEQYFNNRALFSDYYLLQRLPELDEWRNAHETAAMLRAYRTLRVRYDDAREQCSGQTVSALRQKVLLPVLEQLGFVARAGKMRTADVIEPDYRLFAPDAAKNAKPLALCLSYPWGRNLDGKDEQRDKQTPDENPGAVVVTLLDSGEAEWAIVTNGIVWRLYAAKAHSRATNYYEIHLPETLAMEQRELAFRYFWLLFRTAAFQPLDRPTAGETRSLSLLDFLLLESDLHARDLGEKLKTRVFEEIFPYFAEGFVQYARQHGQLPANLDTLPAEERNRLLEPFFTGTLTFLYRLLFLFYAESRDLLPVRQERGYYEYSLERLKQRIAHDAGELHDRVPTNLHAYSATDTTIYDSLQRLFAAVDKGNPAFNMPVYNGGLFMTNPPTLYADNINREGRETARVSPTRHADQNVGETLAVSLSSQPTTHHPEPQEVTVARFLKEHKIPDRQLALGLDRMARDVDEKAIRARAAAGAVNQHSHKLVFIDYKSLGVRHLGSIYEGLLEFKVRVAPTLMAVVKGKRTEEIIPLTEAQKNNVRSLKDRQGNERIYTQGSIYLENDRRERKATGSYYTPDYIVQYIVEQTVGPILKKKLDALTLVFREAQKVLEEQRNIARGLKRKETDAEHETYKKFLITINEAFFDLKVLDPAMGSGHFLVEAVDYITDSMAKLLTRFKWNPIVHELAVTRQTIENSMKTQGISIDSSRLTDLNLLKRRVLKSCIYGVDLNPMAVELTKVSLWLDCFTLGAPLSFLDHHIKCGNSLIGADLHTVHRGIQESLFGYQFDYLLEAAQLMRGVSKRSDVTAQEVAESRDVYQQAGSSLAPYKHLFDVWLSEYFGSKKAQEIASEYSKAITDNDYRNLNKSDVDVIDAAIPLAAKKRFFHWQLEFPEVFFDETHYKDNAGFDAVVGNPPYVRQEGLGDDKTAFKALYEVFNSIADLYTYFIERSHILLRPAGRFSMITANKFMRANYGAALREFLTTKVKLEKLIDFGELRVFGEAATDPLITVTSKDTPNTLIEYMQIKNLDFDSLNDAVKTDIVFLSESALSGANWSLVGDIQQIILSKLNTNSTQLGKYTEDKIRWGIKTGFNEAFVVDRATRDWLIEMDSNSVEVIKPLIVGDDIRHYYFDFKEQYLLFLRRGTNLTKYKAIEQHLLAYKTKLEPKPSNWNDKTQGVWPGRKAGSYKWFEIQDNIAYYAEFEKPKIIYPEIAMSSRFSFDEDGYYVNNKTFMIPLNDKYLLALLNSRLIWTYLKQVCSILGDAEQGGRLELRNIHVETTPIRCINFVTSDKDRAYYLDKAKLLYNECVSKDEKECVLGFVEHHLSQQPEQSDVVHDLLAFLAQTMLDLNQQKRALQKEFLDWLVTTLRIAPDKDGDKAGIEVLTGKSKLLEYAGDYQKNEERLAPDALWEIVLKNRPRLGVSPAQAGLKERVQERYQHSLDAVLPLKEQLCRTDNVIDAVVYKLYGLTEEEIRVVEGGSVGV